MIEMVQDNWPLLLVAFLIGLAVAFLLFRANRRTRVSGESGDVLDEGAAPAARNSALIDAPPAAAGADPIAAFDAAPVGTESLALKPALAQEQMHGAAIAGGGDDLTQIKGIGPKLVAILAQQGINSFAQIAGWSEADIDRIDATLGRFEGRIRRDDWVSQADFLKRGDMSGYKDRFGAPE